MLNLHDWDEDYLLSEVVPTEELNSIEKKSAGKFVFNAKGQPNGDTIAELAKQVSAFSNARQGYLVYGITDDGTLDTGVPIMIGRQSTKEWVEAQIPRLLTPAVTGCQAQVIQVSSHHASDHGVLVVSIPLSEGRPHWTDGERAYIRAGAHSCPMPTQTLLDMSSRTFAAAAEIVSMNATTEKPEPRNWHSFYVYPTVCLLTGTICDHWGFELETKVETIRFNVALADWHLINDQRLFIPGAQPLLPGRVTPVAKGRFQVNVLMPIQGEPELTATLFVGPRPVRRKFKILHDSTLVDA